MAELDDETQLASRLKDLARLLSEPSTDDNILQPAYNRG